MDSDDVASAVRTRPPNRRAEKVAQRKDRKKDPKDRGETEGNDVDSCKF